MPYYEVVLEGVDKALAAQIDDPANGITVRLLVWDMLVIAFSNAEYSSYERKLVKHIVRVMGMDRSVFLEMEQIVKTNAAVENELTWINQSNRPYFEIRPIVDELERRGFEAELDFPRSLAQKCKQKMATAGKSS